MCLDGALLPRLEAILTRSPADRMKTETTAIFSAAGVARFVHVTI
jgi:hypothetical protein